MAIDAGTSGTRPKQSTTPNRVVSFLGLTLDRDNPLTYFLMLGIFTVFLLLLAQKSGSIALGLALTVLLAVAFALENGWSPNA